MLGRTSCLATDEAATIETDPDVIWTVWFRALDLFLQGNGTAGCSLFGGSGWVGGSSAGNFLASLMAPDGSVARLLTIL